ncbi:hypothetical protein SAMN05660328_101308 [Streptococcus gallolyticus]|uniref:DUF4440 domain-containing protein n=1 Tax=Streptococcus gallolyticus TaxID=315405 RepID=A0A1I7FC05_9STRE|nr:nuclear transport factor 2 family protein [Streptococcus gallolyticus]SFC05232.1 hypothetical protein SAMN02983012_0456 [Streptococcus gallolyticus]SFU33719.1 hypothetical protein SAMN05660328_101308 [Streptococcus gallolyticus]
MVFYEDTYTPEQKAIAKELIALEIDALNRFYRGDSSGYAKLWSQTNFSYFDANFSERIDTYEDIYDFLMSRVEGKVKVDHYDFVAPRAQFVGDLAILSYSLPNDDNPRSKHYNVIEVFQRDQNDEWKVIHSTWQGLDPAKKNSGTVII